MNLICIHQDRPVGWTKVLKWGQKWHLLWNIFPDLKNQSMEPLWGTSWDLRAQTVAWYDPKFGLVCTVPVFKESWNAPMKSLECYLVPISITAVNTAWERTCYIVYAIPSERIYWDLKSIFWERNTCKNHWQWANARQINSKENEDSFIF